MQSFGVILALIASACAYSISQPSASRGWTDSGAQPVAWDRVSTDATNFTIVLTNQNRAILPQDQVLVAEQDGVVADSTMVNPPSGGWRAGEHYRINFVRSVDEQNTIYAQSPEFAIRPANTTSSTSVLNTRSVTATPVNTVPAASNAPSSPTAGADGSDTTGNPNSAVATAANAGLMAVLGLVTYIVA